MKKLQLYISLVLASLLSFSACSDMDELNQDANKPSKVQAATLCTKVLLDLSKPNDGKGYVSLNALPKYVGYTQEANPLAEQYNQIGSGNFGLYSVMPNLDDMIKYAKGSEFEKSYQGVYHFARAYMLFDLTMKMGDVPFSDANQGISGNITPKYDTQEQNFVSILKELDAAEEAFAGASEKAFAGDVIYGGNAKQWRLATNSFALRVLMTLSKKENVASLEVKKRFAEIVNKGNLLASNNDNYSLKHADEQRRFHPLYNQDKFTVNTIVSSLVVDNLKKLNDYRLFYYADPAVLKIKNGVSESSMDAYVGIDVSIMHNELNAQHNAGEVSVLNSRYTKLRASEPFIMISYAEQNLILAEAIERGWISGDAKVFYEAGVRAALKQTSAGDPAYVHKMPITEAYINGYFTGEAAYKASKEDRMKQIWMQRYLLRFMQDPTPSFFEYRRNGYPEFPINPKSNLNVNAPNKIPVRWLYPGIEVTKNSRNLKEALIRQFGEENDEINNVMWLLK